ncbi:uncharacterized protein LALA0_S08e00298g [Lachancea lanzarotensis]|uniref:LALA0S08e00298g1_1 n=1 Tax=Lachancea lanzarotensis TaxID=1245769 RepID=A0A0C7N5W9_9SACH|nr:uncharacterized protein LALA0_S08e00298g [Lachancea lanzarotensis]CEP63345.1 LALA0S08e00298g1_1 [Lachancea lanzarotensis]
MSVSESLNILTVQFTGNALLHASDWIGVFVNFTAQYGEGIACTAPEGFADVLTYYPSQRVDLQNALEEFSVAANLPLMWVDQYGKESGASPYNEQMSVWDINGNIKSTCANLNATCYLQEYCGPNAFGSGSADGSAVSSAPANSAPASSALVSSAPVSSAPVSSAPASSVPASSAPVSSAPVSSAPASSAPASSAPASSAPVSSAPVSSTPVSFGSGSNAASASASSSASGSGSAPASSSPAGSLSGSNPAGIANSSPVASSSAAVKVNPSVIAAQASSARSAWAGYKANGTDTTVVKHHPSTTVMTITSCSDNKCTETPVTTGVTTVTGISTTYTTFCPLTEQHAVSNTNSEIAPFLAPYSTWLAPGGSNSGSSAASTVSPSKQTITSTEAAVVCSASTSKSTGSGTSLPSQYSSSQTSSTTSLSVFTDNNGVEVMVSKGFVLAAAALLLL